MATEGQHASNLAWAQRSAAAQEIAGSVAGAIPVIGAAASKKIKGRKKTWFERLVVWIWMWALGLLGSYIPFVGNVAGGFAGRVIGNSKYGKDLLIVAVILLFLGAFLLLALLTLLLAAAGCPSLGVGAWFASWASSDIESDRQFCKALGF